MTKINLFDKTSNYELYQIGQVVFRQGERADKMYVVVEGEVDIVIEGQLIETVAAGSVVGEMALVGNTTRTATARARTDCKLAPVGSSQFDFLIQNTPYFARHIMQIMAERLRHTTQHTVVASKN